MVKQGWLAQSSANKKLIIIAFFIYIGKILNKSIATLRNLPVDNLI
ncbi:hypothetical protein MGMO_133c00010 [Methyloglobulus morosus KoM1]|uniref:Uncharacterized protein n=1 Tax=Methyloglobulus morosus KoM1 TaxID=1116472 RepID=V5DQ71_9GAMM|nr:hypothetical protein MGMO_133c00010 [Methyloglobulus morosus KoM1]